MIVKLWTRLIGSFNAYNILAIYGTAELLGLEKDEILRLISELENVADAFSILFQKKKLLRL